MDVNDIRSYCTRNKITSYKINPDMSIDVDGSVDNYRDVFTELPIKFGKISGNFQCAFNKLTTLENGPSYVDGGFDIQYNQLTSLKGCPKYVGGDFLCHYNKLTTLNDLPIDFYIGGNFNCVENKIVKSIEYGRLLFGHVGGKIYTNYAATNKFLNENKNPPKKDLPRLLSELRKIQL